MPDATGLELLAGELRDLRADSVVDTVHHRGQATIVVDPAFIRDALSHVSGRVRLKLRVPTEHPHVASVVDMFPTANHQEREVYDMFGVVFDGHPDMRRILMPEDYEGFPQRRDFPIGGEPVIFTHNEPRLPAWWK